MQRSHLLLYLGEHSRYLTHLRVYSRSYYPCFRRAFGYNGTAVNDVGFSYGIVLVESAAGFLVNSGGFACENAFLGKKSLCFKQYRVCRNFVPCLKPYYIAWYKLRCGNGNKRAVPIAFCRRSRHAFKSKKRFFGFVLLSKAQHCIKQYDYDYSHSIVYFAKEK